MVIKPLAKNLWGSSPLDMSDLQMTLQARQSYMTQTVITIVQILMKYLKGFETQQLEVALQHHKRRLLSDGHKTVFHPLWASTIEEASIDGNLLVHDNVYLVQLNKTAVPTFNDQLTNAQIQGGQQIWRKDVDSWECCKIFQLGFSSFHLTMNLLWCILKTHLGTLGQTGSLTHLFAILEKAQLGGEHPNYHTLLAALTQILHSLILNTWCNECDYPSLSNFAKADPMPELVNAISTRDFGWAEDILPILTWNGASQTLFASKGIYSIGTDLATLLLKHVTKSLKSGYQGSTHTDVNMSALVWCIANKARELELQTTIVNWEDNLTLCPVANIFTTGFKKFQTLSLATFNKKLPNMRQGSPGPNHWQLEVDEIAPCQVIEDEGVDDLDVSGELSVLHND
ncbi:hypothetical protein EDB86DRAFT_2834206 [Lactarius hatsudake]|nr:hypothetical protein EDB86DRAFT_2834206 [Lactarius hatsudake]